MEVLENLTNSGLDVNLLILEVWWQVSAGIRLPLSDVRAGGSVLLLTLLSLSQDDNHNFRCLVREG